MWIKRVFINLTTLVLKGGKENLVKSWSRFVLSLIKAPFKPVSGRILLLLVVLTLVGVAAFGCVPRGAQPRGWSGGTVTDNTLIFGSMKGQVIALNKSDGGRLWELPLETSAPSGGFGCTPASTAVAIYGTPAVAGDLVYVSGYNGKIYAINHNSGVLRWVYPREGNFEPVVGGPVVAGDKVYIGGSDGRVSALNAATGDIEWEFQAGDKIWSTPVIDGETLYVGSFDKKLYALDVTNGSKKWAPFETEGAIVSTPVVYNNTIYFGSFDRHLYAVDATTGSLRWKFLSGNWFWAKPLVFNNIVYAGSLDGKVYVLDVRSGNKVAEFDLGSPVSSSPVLVDGSIIIATEEGKVYNLDTSNNQKKPLLLADVKELYGDDLAIYSPLSTSEGTLYVNAQTKKYGTIVYALNAQTGVVVWRYSPLSGK